MPSNAIHLVVALLISVFFSHAFAAQPSGNSAIEVLPELSKERLDGMFADPFVVGDADPSLPLWPLFKQEVTGLNLVGYIYESIEYSAIPGFMGIPYNLLVVLDTHGGFVDVRVLFHREPMFIAGVGEQAMHDFVAQYPGLSLLQNLRFNTNQGQAKRNDNNNVYLDGISGATASIRILNQTLLSSALKVARAKLDFAVAKDPSKIAKVDEEVYDDLDWQQLLETGLIRQAKLSVAEAEDYFDRSLPETDGEFIEIYVADLAIPSVGRNLLSPRAWEFLKGNLEAGDHAFLALSAGEKSFIHDDTLRGGISDRLILRQEKLPIELRDLDLEERLVLPPGESQLNVPERLRDADWLVFKVLATTGIDLALPLDFALNVLHDEDTPYRTVARDDFPFSYQVPARYYYEPQTNGDSWQAIWQERLLEILILSIALSLLVVILAKPRLLTKHPRAYPVFRYSFLLFTLVFIGWYAQGQLSIVNITGAIQSLMLAGNIDFFLYDPMTTLIWLFVLGSFLIWGRGTFCGWLCPFGALQELMSKVLSLLRLKSYQPSDRLDKQLKTIKYGVLLVILACAVFYPQLADTFVEIEPFKTAITFFFVREWPFVLWAVALVLVSGLVYKGYCRYVCPLGAAMALGGKLRFLNWLKRRQECGSPCQLCMHACQYKAISRAGTVDYDECFQCLDCVVIYDNDSLCVPKIIEKKNGRKLGQQPTASGMALPSNRLIAK